MNLSPLLSCLLVVLHRKKSNALTDQASSTSHVVLPQIGMSVIQKRMKFALVDTTIYQKKVVLTANNYAYSARSNAIYPYDE